MQIPTDDFGSSSANYSRPSKVQIPRMVRLEQPPKSKSEPTRVSKACMNCRKRKVKCTGDVPTCKQCEQSGVTCVYEPHKRDRLQTQKDIINDMVKLLKDLRLRASDEDRDKIALMLQSSDLNHSHGINSPTSGDDRRHSTSRSDWENHGNPRRDSRCNSLSPSVSDEYTRITSTIDTYPPPDELDNQLQPSGPSGILADDLSRSQSSRERGLVGSMSEMHWLRLFYSQERPTPLGPITSYDNPSPPRYLESFSYYVDDLPVGLGITIDPHELPDISIARKLFACYMNVVHKEFSILPDSFASEFEKLCHSSETGYSIQVSNPWKTLLNLVFAIGAHFSHLVDAQWQGSVEDHRIYMSRASQLLGIENTVSMLSAPDISFIQALALLSFYFMTIGQIGRSWSAIGMALRSALSLGLHLRNGDTSMELNRRISLVRTWWGLHSVECLLGSITGRPSVAANEHITVPLPHKLSSSQQDEAFSGTLPFLDAHIMIGLITQDVLTHLYSQRTAIKSSGQLQKIVASLMKTLENWAHQAMPEGLHTATSGEAAHTDRCHLIFAFYYYKTKILITRPCLQRLHAHVRDRSGEDPAAVTKTAEDCVRAALDLTALLPSTPDPRWVYENGPWWTVVHSIMQALTVLILEITYPSQKAALHPLEESIFKLLHWLKTMRQTNVVAKRAHHLASSILLHSRPRLPAPLRAFLLDDTPEPSPSAGTPAPTANFFHPYGYSPPWATSSFGANVLGPVQSGEYVPSAFPPRHLPDMGTAFAEGRNSAMPFYSDTAFTVGNASVGNEDLLFPLQPVVGMDIAGEQGASDALRGAQRDMDSE